MSWPVYSETFIRHFNVMGYSRYTVPAGHRAILTEIALTNAYGTTNDVQVEVGPILYFERKFLATERSSIVACRTVLYGGESLSVYHDHAGTGSVLSGYLFLDPAGRTGPDREAVTRGELPAEGRPLPVESIDA